MAESGKEGNPIGESELGSAGEAATNRHQLRSLGRTRHENRLRVKKRCRHIYIYRHKFINKIDKLIFLAFIPNYIRLFLENHNTTQFET